MAPILTRALGAMKDQTSIALAKVSGNAAPKLHVAIIRATSHNSKPPSESLVRQIVSMMSNSSECIGACIDILSRRIGKTRDWVVALKALMLTHRLLTDGDPAFQHEILVANRRGVHLLNMADFSDTALFDSRDHSAFVRTYALYLDQSLEYMICQRTRGDGSSRSYFLTVGIERFLQPSQYEYRVHDHSGKFLYSASSKKGGAIRFGDEQRNEDERKPRETLKKMKIERVLERFYELQRLLNRFFACRPSGKAASCRMILLALHPVVRESFRLYADIWEVLDVILDRFFDMDYPDSVKSFDAYASAARQISELCCFYSWCKSMGVARTSEYPEMRRITLKILETMREFIRDKAKTPNCPLYAEEILEPRIAIGEEVDSERDPKPSEALAVVLVKQQQEGDLLDLSDDAETSGEQSNKLAEDLFQWPVVSCVPSTGVITSAWQNPAVETGTDDWEMIFVETKSNLSNQKANLDGGLDELLLSSMYEQEAVRQPSNTQLNYKGNASSMGAGQGGAPVLSLPAAEHMVGEYPFAASLGVPPPPCVQMADTVIKKQLLVQEHVMWQQYAYSGMQAPPSLVAHSSPFMVNPTVAYGMPVTYNTVGGYYYRMY